MKKPFLLLVALAAFTPPLLAGNIPQYRVSKGPASAAYSEFTQGWQIPCDWTSGTYALLPDGSTSPNVVKSEGYPIGFDFRFAGTTVNRFLPSNTGDIYLGKEKVTYGDGCFCVSMSLVKHGLKAGEISYKTTGDEGNRILTVQWKNATINQSSGYVGKYNLQFRFHEKDGRIEMAFKEVETPGASNGFDTSIHGWDGRDAILLTASGLDKPVSVSPNFTSDMLTPSSYIKWDADDYDNGYSPVFVFTPESDITPPTAAPANLKVTEDNGSLSITCDRAEGSAATAILYSTSPFTDADMPVDGETFPAGQDRGGLAIPLYYSNDAVATASVRNIREGSTYYIRAVSANGYPAWNRTDFAEVVYSTSQAAPSSLEAGASGPAALTVRCEADSPVIIAATDTPAAGYGKGYVGQFGVPSATAKAGDAMEGGGKVVYAGEAGRSVEIETSPNTLTYLRAWTVRDGRLSSTCTDCSATPAVSYPYAPAIETYPQGMPLQGWEALPAGQGQFIPLPRNEADDLAVRATSGTGTRVTLRTPALPLGSPLRVSFEWAMETVRASESSEDSGSVELPKGNRPGEFGSGSLDLAVGGTTYRSVNSYGGTMAEFAPGEYVTGSSTYESFSAEIPAGSGSGSLEISFAGDKGNTSQLYIRNLLVETVGEVETAPACAPTALRVDEDRDGFLHVGCTRGEDAARTVVLVSEVPVTAADLPADGIRLTAGTRTGNAVVIYSGEDTEVACATDGSTLVSDYDTPYHVAAVSVSPSALYNRTDITQVEYRTLPDFGAPTALAAEYDAERKALDITATRHANAETTLILVSAEAPDTAPADGGEYAAGTTLGNATVAYHGADAEVTAHHELAEVPDNVTVTAWSRNVKGWYSTQSRTVTVPTVNVSVDGIDIDPSLTDLTGAEVYDITGLRLRAARLTDLPAGLYIINGRKVTVR